MPDNLNSQWSLDMHSNETLISLESHQSTLDNSIHTNLPRFIRLNTFWYVADYRTIRFLLAVNSMKYQTRINSMKKTKKLHEIETAYCGMQFDGSSHTHSFIQLASFLHYNYFFFNIISLAINIYILT